MNICITGVAGFIGSHTANALCQKGHTIIGIDCINDYYSPIVKHWNIDRMIEKYPHNFIFYQADITDFKAMDTIFAKEKIHIICHLAARAGVRPSIDDPLLYETVNVRGTLIMLEMAKKYAVQNFVYASSSSVYGECKTTPFSENLKLDHPISPYAASKKANENYAFTYSHLYGIPTTGLRFFTVYGPSGRPDMAPFLFTKAITESIPIKKFGDGTTQRDYTYIDDIVDGIIACIMHPHPYEIFNLGNNHPISLNSFIDILENTIGKKAIIQSFPLQPGDVSITYADIRHAQEKIGYTPKISFSEGIERFVKWYHHHKNLYI